MKAGTSALHHHLDHHPDVAMARGKELNFFFGPDQAPHDDESTWWRDGQWHRGLDWYAGCFDASARVRGESSPGYTAPSRPGVAARIREVLPDVRLVHLVRDPAARALSQWRHHVRDGAERRPAAEALLDPGSEYLARSRYAERLAPYLDHFPREQLLVVVQERLLQDPRAELSRVFAHVGADPGYWDEAFRRRVHVGAVTDRAHDPGGQDGDGDLADRFREAVAEDVERLRAALDDPLPEWGPGS